MLRTFLPRLIKRAQAGAHRSGVIDLSSLSSSVVDDKGATYGAIKLFNRFLTNGLYNEIGSRGVNFLSVQPSFVRTNMAKEFEEKGYDGFINVDECVHGALSNLGRFKETPGGKGHIGAWYILEMINWMLDDCYLNFFVSMLIQPPKED